MLASILAQCTPPSPGHQGLVNDPPKLKNLLPPPRSRQRRRRSLDFPFQLAISLRSLGLPTPWPRPCSSSLLSYWTPQPPRPWHGPHRYLARIKLRGPGMFGLGHTRTHNKCKHVSLGLGQVHAYKKGSSFHPQQCKMACSIASTLLFARTTH